MLTMIGGQQQSTPIPQAYEKTLTIFMLTSRKPEGPLHIEVFADLLLAVLEVIQHQYPQLKVVLQVCEEVGRSRTHALRPKRAELFRGRLPCLHRGRRLSQAPQRVDLGSAALLQTPPPKH